ncbi:MAG: hypothetical protein AB1726_17765 [Planctomycetota bacterium]
MIREMILAAGLAGLLAGGTVAQESGEGAAVASAAKRQFPVVDESELTIWQFAPRFREAETLYKFAGQSLARNYEVERRGGSGSTIVANMSLLGDTIVLYDVPEQVKRISSMLQELDVAPRVELTTFEYHPRYVAISSLSGALRSYQRHIVLTDAHGQSRADNIAWMQDRSVVIVRDTKEAVAEIQALLARIDVPEPQVTITCWVIRGGKEGSGAGLPAELTENLARLVPELRFTAAGFALIRTAAAPGRPVELHIEGTGADTYDLAFVPSAYDPKMGSLTIDQCQLKHRRIETAPASEGRPAQFSAATELFTTNTILRGGEYTVLGATGTEPVFLVVRLLPVP